MPVRVLPAGNFLSREKPFYVAGISDFAAGEHTHAGFLEFFLVYSGRGRHRVNGAEHDVTRGSLVLVREGDVHSMLGEGLRQVNVAFEVGVAAEAVRFLGRPHWLPRLQRPGRVLTVQLDGRTRQVFQGRLDEARALYPGQDLLLRALLLEVLQRVLYSPAQETSQGERNSAVALPEWLETLCVQLQRPEHFLRPVRALPSLAHKSPEHLARSFRRHLGTTPTDFVNAQRLDHAARLLAETDRKILAVALECGFEQPGYFHRLFRRRFGRTPLRYRQLGRQLAAPEAFTVSRMAESVR